MDIDEDWQIPITLERSFLAIAGAIINVKRRKLTFEVGGKKIDFIIEKPLKNLSLMDSYCLVDLIIGCVQDRASKPPPTNKLEECLFDGAKVDKDDIKAKSYGEILDESQISTNQGFEVPVMKGDKANHHRPCLGL